MLDDTRTISDLDITNADATLEIRGNGAAGHIALTVSGLATNTGIIRLAAIDDEWDATLTANLTNIGALATVKGSGGRRAFAGTLANSGTVLVDWPLSLTGAVTNTGELRLNQGVADSGAVTFNQNAGAITGPGTLSLQNDAFNYNHGKVDAPTRLTRVTLTTAGSATGGATFTLLGNPSTLAGTVSPGTTVIVQGDAAAGFGSSYVAAGTVNNGTLRLTSTAVFTEAQIFTLGLFTNSGAIIGDVGAGGARGLGGTITNTGSMTFDQIGNFSDLTLTNTGSIVLNAPVIGNGNPVTINQNAGSITGTGALTLTNVVFNYVTGPITAPMLFTKGTLTTAGSATGGATFTLLGNPSTLAGTVSPGTTVIVQGDAAAGFGSSYVAAGTVNNGTLRLTSTAAFTEAQIFTLGLFTNSGAIIGDVGAGGARGLGGTITNTGSMTFDQIGNFSDLTLTNTGSIVLNAPVIGNGNPVTINQNGGSITGTGALTLTNVAFNYATGPVTAPMVLTNAALTTAGGATGGASFTLQGPASTLAGTVSPTTAVVIRGSGADTAVNAAAGVTNLGSISLTSAGGPWGAALTAGGAGLSNSGSLNVAAGTGGARTLGGRVLNTVAGAVTVNANTSMGTAAANHANHGTLTLAGGTALAVNGAGATLTNTGTIGGGGALVLTNVALSGTGSVTHTFLAGTASVSPGLPLGAQTMTGVFNQAPGASLNIELGGTTPGVTFDRLNVLGTATLTGGTLNVSVTGGFVPCDGASFDVLTYGARTGTFATLNGLTLGPGHTLTIAYLANAFRLTSNGGPACVAGGKNLKMATGSIDLSWTGGNVQAGYTLLQYNTSTTAATLISLAAAATSYSDTAATNGVMYCYVLVPTSAGGAALGLSDLLCGMAGMESGAAIPNGFALTLNQTANATMTWTAPAGGATSYLLVRIPLDGSPITNVSLAGSTTSSVQTVTAVGTCFQLIAYQGLVFGNSDVLCGIPGVSTLRLTAADSPWAQVVALVDSILSPPGDAHWRPTLVR